MRLFIILFYILFSSALFSEKSSTITISQKYLDDTSNEFKSICQDKENGKMVKFERRLNEFNKQLNAELGKYQYFKLPCSLLWSNRGAGFYKNLSCKKNVNVFFSTADVKKELIEKLQDIPKSNDEIVEVEMLYKFKTFPWFKKSDGVVYIFAQDNFCNKSYNDSDDWLPTIDLYGFPVKFLNEM